ncbi:hypothetical protein E2650_05480 [Shewanella xiamenensis]|uniref:Uncharacterized protein n=1 Tax=Shewanella xiamenensis TaxID=332186 RepID=A0AAW6QTH2_9GAMM|nr:hypothetical protein [Shewanella xiamenensis]MDG5899362.1 hypothetical protein [Shewanella xiamenensis]
MLVEVIFTDEPVMIRVRLLNDLNQVQWNVYGNHIDRILSVGYVKTPKLYFHAGVCALELYDGSQNALGEVLTLDEYQWGYALLVACELFPECVNEYSLH